MSSVAFQYDIVEDQTSPIVNDVFIDDFEINEDFSYGNLETEKPVDIPTNKVTQLLKIDLINENEDKLKHNLHYSFKALLDTYGVISEVSEEGIISADIYHHNGEYMQEVEFSISEFEESERYMIENDAVFYWRVGQKTVNGTTSDTSEFRMRRLVTYNFPFNKKKIEEISKKYKSVFGNSVYASGN